jgi:hypothetical protein
VKIAVGLTADERDRCPNSVDVPLEREPRGRERFRRRPSHKEAQRRSADRKKVRTILQRLHRPPLGPAQRPRATGGTYRWKGRAEDGSDGRDGDDSAHSRGSNRPHSFSQAIPSLSRSRPRL